VARDAGNPDQPRSRGGSCALVLLQVGLFSMNLRGLRENSK
jgi:hypothetical protein